MSEPILQCTGLCKSYGKKDALRDVTFALERGRIVGLLGPNGSGKSTLIKLANGLLTPTAGEIRIAGNLPGPITHAQVSYLPERTYLSDWMTADDLLKFFSNFYEDFNLDKAADMLTRLGISPKDSLKTMSKGTKEKIQLVVVMSREADLYLLDEPFAALDAALRKRLTGLLLRHLDATGASAILVTHQKEDARRFGGTLLEL